ncbi:cryptochrome/photolyase family protein [Flavobacterium zepuense]|uniref:Cryptochrome/photolyase family protein n=1 Tax=Flavobacterium zepuense TaxID=2593302 RepID=A0A552UZL9_9FLAO|nr:cryptochrome/photolyase family protein [Flavobacterium zepuense]TRW23683.1 cryptochrome/photolyase family protein [Flavobacterium zepuense]
MEEKYKTLRLVLGDQLNLQHTWFSGKDSSVLYALMEVKTETDYVWHHIQKVCAIFAAMEEFANALRKLGHEVCYIKLDDLHNKQSFQENCDALIDTYQVEEFQYQMPDEYRLDQALKVYCANLTINNSLVDTEHFFTHRNEVAEFFLGKKSLLMENFYRHMRKRHSILMLGTEPVGGQWNFDQENRKKLPKNHKPFPPLLLHNDVTVQHRRITATGVKVIGTIQANDFQWPVNRQQSKELLDHFITYCLPLFGTFQDAMHTDEWYLYHSRLSFSLNTKMLSPMEVIDAATEAWHKNRITIDINQVEGFVRQILGWREYMRGIYWMNMPDFETMNFFGHERTLPQWYWSGQTKMNCLRSTIGQSLQSAYAHHIQRLMITGNFALLAGIAPEQVDFWYLGIYIDAIQWVEITNTRGMSQYADGGIIGSKPYTASANYIHKMSNYCDGCRYDHTERATENACPFNSLYWDFHDRHQLKLREHPRLKMVYALWDKMELNEKEAILNRAAHVLKNIDNL